MTWGNASLLPPILLIAIVLFHRTRSAEALRRREGDSARRRWGDDAVRRWILVTWVSVWIAWVLAIVAWLYSSGDWPAPVGAMVLIIGMTAVSTFGISLVWAWRMLIVPGGPRQ